MANVLECNFVGANVMSGDGRLFWFSGGLVAWILTGSK